MNAFDIYCSSGPFMPHGGCYLWSQSLIALHAISDAFIVLAYYSIPVTLIYFVRKRKDLKFHWMFVCFAVFILACGTTHLMEIWNIWHADYWLSGGIKALTALASVPTALLLVRLIPQALALPSPGALEKAYGELELRVQARTAELLQTTKRLEAEVAERTKAEEEIRKLNAELELRVLLRTTALENANKELEAFSYSVSHDLRAPLRAINGFANIVEEDFGPSLPQEGRDYLNRIRKGSQRMGELIDDLLAFARLSRQPLNRRPLDMTQLVKEALTELNPLLAGRHIHLQVGNLNGSQGDPALLRQAWINLLSNAVKYSRDRKPAVVEVGCLNEPAGPVYFVRDNGVGFDMKYVDKLFGVFQRLHRMDEFEGTGVGLAIVQRIIQRHGGRVWADGKPGQGATFYFTIGEEKT